jgi:hypothetical protein
MGKRQIMGQYVYAGWFKDNVSDPGDQDHEWVACLLIEAETVADAQAWGDHLAKRMCARRTNEEFLWSEVRTPDDTLYVGTDISGLPVVQYGVEETDEQIGW